MWQIRNAVKFNVKQQEQQSFLFALPIFAGIPMIGRLQNNKLLRFFWVLLTLFLLNTSIDMADDMPSNITEDLSFNEQESILEYVLEEMMGIEDAIPESEDNDPSQHTNIKKSTGFDQFIISAVITHREDYPVCRRKAYRPQEVFFIPGSYTKITTPPPEV